MNQSAALAEATNVIQVPEYFYAVDINYLTHMIADMLSRLITHNDLIPLTPANLTRFHSRTPPNISLSDYLRRIVKYTSVEKSCLLILLIYIDRVCELHPHFTISSLTVHRFLITAVTVSSKALCDSYCTNSHYAKVGGISTHEINALELEFLSLIDWHLASTGPILQQYYANLIEQHPCYERKIGLLNEEESTSKKRRRSSTSVSVSESVESASESAESAESASESAAISESASVIAATATVVETKVGATTNTLETTRSKVLKRNNSLDGATADKDSSKIEEERTIRHFDTILEDESIPYIA